MYRYSPDRETSGRFDDIDSKRKESANWVTPSDDEVEFKKPINLNKTFPDDHVPDHNPIN